MNPRERALRRAERQLRRVDCDTLGLDLRLLLPLPLWQEEDLYALMAEEVREKAGLSLLDFPAVRVQAAGNSLDEQYADLSDRLLGVEVRELAQRERALRMRLPLVMEDALNLMTLARNMGKRVVLFSRPPSMLTNGEVLRMLAERRLPQPDGLCFDAWTEDLNRPGTLVVSADKPDHTWRSVTLPSGMRTPWPMPPGAMDCLGMRTMMAVTCLHPGAPRADFAAYGALGMFLFSTAMWLAEECCRTGLSRMVFLSRDGFLVRQAFDQVRDVLGLPIASGYLRTSPQAVLPLHIRQGADLLGLTAMLEPGVYTPRSLLAMLETVADPAAAVLLLTEAGFVPDEPLGTFEMQRFLQIFRERCFIPEKFEQYRQEISAYLAKWVKGRCGTFGAGEDLLVEAAIAEAAGADITAFVPFVHGEASLRWGVAFRALLNGSPAIRGEVFRWFLEEENAPCLRYEGGKAVRGPEPPINETLTAFRTQALTFVHDMVRIFGEEIAQLVFRPSDGCLPFELFLLNASWQETEAFRAGEEAVDDPVLSWRLQQSDARGGAFCLLRRGLVRLRHSPGGAWRYWKGILQRGR